jgi:hypothetical protein
MMAATVWRWSAVEPAGSPAVDAPWYLERPERAALLFVAANGPRKCRVNVRDVDGVLYTFDVDLSELSGPPTVTPVTGPARPAD